MEMTFGLAAPDTWPWLLGHGPRPASWSGGRRWVLERAQAAALSLSGWSSVLASSQPLTLSTRWQQGQQPGRPAPPFGWFVPKPDVYGDLGPALREVGRTVPPGDLSRVHTSCLSCRHWEAPSRALCSYRSSSIMRDPK